MSTTTIEELSKPRAQAAQISQTTAVEQARAVAEVAAAVRVAQDFPRDLDKARAQMLQACNTLALAERAFYSVPNRGSGPSVHLARELARCWGNVQHGTVELRRDDTGGESEMQSFAWDVENNSRSVRSFINPHVRMAGGRRKALTDTNDIINNNNNAGARAVRETIFNVLPVWFREEAMDLCRATLERGNGEPLDKRIEKAVATFARIDVTPEQLEARLSRTRDRWDEQDVASLVVLWQSLNTGDTTKEEEFPNEASAPSNRVTAADIKGDGTEPAPDEPASVPTGGADPWADGAS